MDFIDGHRPLEPRPGVGAAIHPVGVAPLVRRAADNRRRQRRHLELEAERIRLDEDLAALGAQLELVAMAEPAARHEDLPHAAHAEPPHRVHAAVPVVEVADDAGARGVGGPDGEVDAFRRADGHRVGAKLVVDAGVIALAEEVEVVVGDDAAESIRIVDLRGVVAGVGHTEAIVDIDIGIRRLWKRGLVDAGRMASRHDDRRHAAADDAHRLGRRQARAYHESPTLHVWTEHGERIGVERAGDGVKE